MSSCLCDFWTARGFCRARRQNAVYPFPRASVAVTFSQLGGVRLYGSAEEEMPFPGVCMRPMVLGL